MDHFRRRHRVQRGFALGIVFAVLAVSPATAWTQLDNEYPNSPVSCTDINPYYCIEWPADRIFRDHHEPADRMESYIHVHLLPA